MTITEADRQGLENKMRCHTILMEALAQITAEGLTDRFDDALVDFLVTVRHQNKKLLGDETLRRIGGMRDDVALASNQNV